MSLTINERAWRERLIACIQLRIRFHRAWEIHQKKPLKVTVNDIATLLRQLEDAQKQLEQETL